MLWHRCLTPSLAALAAQVLGLLGFVVADSVNVFTRKAPAYSARVQQIAAGVLAWADEAQDRSNTQQQQQQQHQLAGLA